VPSHRVATLARERGIDFEPQEDCFQEVRLSGGDDELIAALKGAKVMKPMSVDPAALARQAEIRRHVLRGTEFKQKEQYAEAEQKYRAALLFDPHNPDLYDCLAIVLIHQNKWDEAASAARQALRLDPKDEQARDFLVLAHNNFGFALEQKGDLNGAIAEYHELLRLDPNNALAHASLGTVLEKKDDLDSAIAEYREVLRLKTRTKAPPTGKLVLPSRTIILAMHLSRRATWTVRSRNTARHCARCPILPWSA
jgi:tetratricopeptide (TPR) repeat protein